MEEEQYMNHLDSQRKRSDNIELPDNFEVGQADSGGDCFFDSVAQGLKRLKPEMEFTVKSLRKVCKDLTENNEQLKNKIIMDARNPKDPTTVIPDNNVSDDKLWNAYLARIKYTSDDLNKMRDNNPYRYQSLISSKYGNTLQAPIWGRPDIEGQLICKAFNVKLHVIEKNSDHQLWLHQVVDKTKSTSIENPDYNDMNTIHIVNEQHLHFKPILYKQTIQHKRLSPDSSDYDDEITPEEDLINTIKSTDLEEEKLAKIKRLFEGEQEPNINFQDKNNDTPLHIAIRKRELEVIKLLVQKGAKVNNDCVRNKKNRTPLDTAKYLRRQDIVQILEPDIQPNLQAFIKQPSIQYKRKRIDSEKNKFAICNLKKQRTSSPDQQPVEDDVKLKSRPSSPKRPILSTSNNLKQRSDIQENRKPTGLLTSYHGVAYQVQWIMAVALEAQERLNSRGSGAFKFKTIDFKTEDPDAGKFDDLVWRYKIDEKDEQGKNSSKKFEYNFLQAKHKLNKGEKITLKEFLKPKQKDGSLKLNKKDKRPFALEKYFLSYRDEIKKKYSENGKINKLIIATNIDFDNDLKSNFDQLRDNIPILDLIKKETFQKPENWKFREGDFPHQKVKEQLEGTYDLIKIARDLGKCVLNNEPIKQDSTLHSYLYALKQNKVIESSGKFHFYFIGDHQNLSKEAKQLRIAFFQEAFTNKRKSLGFNIDYKISYPQELAEQIASKIIESFKKSKKEVTINKTGNMQNSGIDDLAGYILIEKDGGIRFNTKFWMVEDNELPSDSLRTFRDKLKSQLESKIKNSKHDRLKKFKEQELNVFINQFKEYQFNIRSKDPFRTCKEMLGDEDAFWKNVKDFQFNQLDRLNPDQSSSELPSHELKDIEKDINDFFGRLIFVVNYSKEILNEFIEKKCSWFVRFETDYIAYEFQAKIANALDLEEKEFISTAKDVGDFFRNAENKLNNLVLIGPTLLHKAQIEEYGIQFEENCIKELFKYTDSENNQKSYDFLHSNKKVLSLITEQSDLTSIKVYQAVCQAIQGKYIFMSLSSVLRIKGHVLSAFKECNLLVIECNNKKKNLKNDVHRLYDSLKSKLNGNKKIILITQEKNLPTDNLANKFKKAFSNGDIDGYEKKDERNSLTDLTIDSQKKLLNKGKVIFQGEKGISLSTLVDNGSKYLINGKILSKLINNEKIMIGKALLDSKYKDIKDYYIDRIFNRYQLKISQDFAKRSEFLVTYNSEVNRQNLKEDQDIILISDTSESFKDLCNKYKERNIHWLKNEENNFIYHKSYGSSTKLYEFVNLHKLVQEYKPEKITDITDKVVIISAGPGMGKSTVLTSLALKTKESNPFLWVIRVNLLGYSIELKIATEKEIQFNKETEAIRFLYRMVDFQLFQKEKRKQKIEEILSLITVKYGKIGLKGNREEIKSRNLLEIGLFNNFYNQGRIALLFDGFDEISPDYAEKVIELLQILKNTKVRKLWITTRPYNFVQEKLEDKLNIHSYLLKPLLLEEQKDFLRKFWEAKLKLSKLDEQRSGVFINKLLDKLSKSISNQDFISIPLHAFMVAEVFKGSFKSFYDSNNQELSDKHKKEIEEHDLITLYETFIDIKFKEIRFGEKEPGLNIDNPDMKESLKVIHKKFIADHKKLALYAIFNKYEVEKLLPPEKIEKVIKLIDAIKQGKEKSGIIEKVINNKPIFTHFTFAEYFVANYFWEIFKSVQFNKFKDFVENNIIENLIKYDMIQTSKFLQLKAKKDLEKNIEISDKQDKLKTLLIKLLDKTKNFGPNNDNKKSVKLLFGIIEFSCLIKEESNLDVIKPNDQLKLLCVSAEMGYIKLANALETKLETKFLKEYLECDEWDYSPIWLAAKNTHLDVLKILVKNFSYGPNWEDKYKRTLIKRIFERKEFNVLRSCLKSDIVDGKPYGIQKLPIIEAFDISAPLDVIKLLIEKTDGNIVNRFKFSEWREKNCPFPNFSLAQLISIQSLKYDKEIIKLAIEKGIDFSEAINSLLSEFGTQSLNIPIVKLSFANYFPFCFDSDKIFLNLFERIEQLLKAGVNYNSKDTSSRTILQYAQQIHYIHKLLNGVHKLYNQKNDKSSNPLNTILKLMIDILGSPPYLVNYIIDKSLTGQKILRLKYKSSEYNKTISLLPNLKFYKNSNTNLVKNALHNLSSYIADAKKEIEEFKPFYFRTTYDKILISYEAMLHNTDCISNIDSIFYIEETEIEERYASLNKYEKDLLEAVFNLYIKQNYEINDSLKEVSEEVMRYKEISSRIKKNTEYETKEILDILDLKSIDTNKELQDFILKIHECGGIELLSQIWSNLHYIGQKRIMETLEEMFKFSDQSSKIFKLLQKLDSPYKALTKAIENKNYQEMNNILQNVKPDFIKAIVNGQDDEYGSPLHYAIFKCDVEATEILLKFNANPNLGMRGKGTLLSTAEQDEDLLPEDDYYEGCTPLHLAVRNSQLKFVEILAEAGADVDIADNRGITVLHDMQNTLDQVMNDGWQNTVQHKELFKVFSRVLKPKYMNDDVIINEDNGFSQLQGIIVQAIKTVKLKYNTILTAKQILQQINAILGRGNHIQYVETLLTLEFTTDNHYYNYWLQQIDIARAASLYYNLITDGNHTFEVINLTKNYNHIISVLNQFMENAAQQRLTFIISVNDMHWVTLVTQRQNETYIVYHTDSPYTPRIINNDDADLQKICPLDRIIMIIQNILGNNVRIENVSIYHRIADHNCGLWALEDAKDINQVLQQEPSATVLNKIRNLIVPDVSIRDEEYFQNLRRDISQLFKNNPQSLDTQFTTYLKNKEKIDPLLLEYLELRYYEKSLYPFYPPFQAYCTSKNVHSSGSALFFKCIESFNARFAA